MHTFHHQNNSVDNHVIFSIHEWSLAGDLIKINLIICYVSHVQEPVQSATFSLDGSVLIIGCTTGHWFVMDAETREVYSMHTDGAEPIQVLATLFVSSESLCNNSFFFYNQHLLFVTHYIALIHFSEHAFYLSCKRFSSPVCAHIYSCIPFCQMSPFVFPSES